MVLLYKPSREKVLLLRNFDRSRIKASILFLTFFWDMRKWLILATLLIPGVSLHVKPQRNRLSCLKKTAKRQRNTLISQQSGISRFSCRDRKVLGGLALLGFLETGYINIIKFGFSRSLKYSHGESLQCLGGEASTCNNILNGPWANFLGVPLTVPGMLSYATILVLAILPLCIKESPGDGNSRYWGLIDVTEKGLLAVTLAMAIFSAFLMVLLVFKIHASCPWCFFSAAVSLGLSSFTLLRVFKDSEGHPSDFKAVSISAAFTTLFVAFFLVDHSVDIGVTEARVNINTDRTNGIKSTALKVDPSITRTSSLRALTIAKALRTKEAKLYGAFWCSHCHNQKQLLGREAMQLIDYIECAGENVDQLKICESKKIPGYPTWEIDGRLFAGEMTLDELQDILNSVSEATVKESNEQIKTQLYDLEKVAN